MAYQGIRLAMEPQRVLAFGSIGAAYMGIGTPVDHPVRMYEVYNLTDVDLQFSLNGVDDHFPLPANGYKVIDIVTNKVASEGWYIEKGLRFYVKEMAASPTSGSVYIAIAYGE